MEHRRLFVAIDFPSDVITQIQEIQKQLQKQNLFTGRFTKPEHIHLTLKFVGEVDQKTHHQVQEALEKIAFPRLQLSLGRLGVFFVKRKASIIWISIEGEGQLAKAIEDALRPIVPKEGRDFVSHVTIARVKEAPDQEALLTYLSQMPIPAMNFTATEFVLKDSVLSQEGPHYEIIERYPLR